MGQINWNCHNTNQRTVVEVAAVLRGHNRHGRSGQREIGVIQCGNGRLCSGRSFTLWEGNQTTDIETPMGGCRDYRRHDPTESDTILLEFLVLGWERARLIVYCSICGGLQLTILQCEQLQAGAAAKNIVQKLELVQTRYAHN